MEGGTDCIRTGKMMAVRMKTAWRGMKFVGIEGLGVECEWTVKQSRSNWLPFLNELLSFDKFRIPELPMPFERVIIYSTNSIWRSNKVSDNPYHFGASC